MILREFGDTADTRDVHDAGSEVATDVLRTLLQQASERGSNIVNAEGVDLIEPRPLVETIIVEERVAESLSVLLLRGIGSVQPAHSRAHGPGARETLSIKTSEEKEWSTCLRVCEVCRPVPRQPSLLPRCCRGP